MSNQICPICQQPLGESEIALNRNWHFDCQHCHICNESITSQIIEKCLSESRPPAHDTCYKTQMFRNFQTQDLVIGLEQIHFLNEQINKFFPAVNPETVNLELMQALVEELCQTAAAVSQALGTTKDKLKIQNIRTWNQEQKAKTQKEKEAKVETEKEKIAKQERTAQLAAERENPQLRNRRRAIESAAKAFPNMTPEQVATWVDNEMNKKRKEDVN